MADETTNDVSRITPDGTVSIFAELAENGGSNGLAFGPSGNLFVSNYMSGVINEITPMAKRADSPTWARSRSRSG